MADNLEPNSFANAGNRQSAASEYRARAFQACEAGDRVLGMHLFLAAYERAMNDPDGVEDTAFASLREAWNLACDLKERSMAEYVFEKLEPYLTGTEIARYANKLQSLALDRLEEYGFSREELQEMAELISQDLADGEASVVKVESISIPRALATDAADSTSQDAPEPPQQQRQDASGSPRKPEQVGIGRPGPEFNPYELYDTSSVGMSYHAATNEGAGSYVFTRDADRATALERSQAAEETAAVEPSERAAIEPVSDQETTDKASDLTSRAQQAPASAEEDEMPSEPDVAGESAAVPLTYRTLAGYGEVISIMREAGIGLTRDPGFHNFVNMMNARHGVDRMPALDTLMFRAPTIEDAARFADATAGELDLPVLRMSMEEGMQGMPMLCVTMEGNRRPRMNHAHNRFEGPGVLILEDLDMWEMPHVPEGAEGITGFVMANISRGAREAMNLIRSSVEDPDVYVLATATMRGEIDPFFYDLLEPLSVIDIADPTDSERDEIWAEILRDHSSMAGLDRAALVRYSAGLARYDIYMAARAAVEEAYKAGLAQRAYIPVDSLNIYDKIAACQPLDSEQYRAIEDEIVSDFRESLEAPWNLDDGRAG